MKKNMGVIDRSVRIMLGILVAVLYLMDMITGTAVLILGIVAVIFIVTGFIGFCPLYVPFNIKTFKE